MDFPSLWCVFFFKKFDCQSFWMRRCIIMVNHMSPNIHFLMNFWKTMVYQLALTVFCTSSFMALISYVILMKTTYITFLIARFLFTLLVRSHLPRPTHSWRVKYPCISFIFISSKSYPTIVQLKLLPQIINCRCKIVEIYISDQ